MARIEIRATEDDRQHWSEKAKAAGLTLSGLIRQALSDAPMPRRRRRSAVDPALLRELAKIGNNLNQLAMLERLNEVSRICGQQMQAYAKQIESLRKALRKFER